MVSHELALTVFRNLLRPAARLAVRYGLQLNEGIEALKEVLVEAAEGTLSKTTAAKATDSRPMTPASANKVSGSKVSAMTGVHRKDIARFRAQSASLRRPANLISRIMVQWQHGAQFITKAGKPRVLGCEGRDSEFAKLAVSVNGGDISGYAVLFEMERRGIVERKNGTVKLVWRDFSPSDDLREQLLQWGEDTVDLSTAVEENLFEEAEAEGKNHHLKTVFDNIAVERLPAVREWLMQEGSLFHKRARQFLSSQDIDLAPELKGRRGGIRVALASFSVCPRLLSRDTKESI